jgi:hypothetical protein
MVPYAWLYRPVTLEAYRASLQSGGGGPPIFLHAPGWERLRTEVEAALAGGGDLWEYREGPSSSPLEGNSGLVVLRGGSVVAEFRLHTAP